VFPFGQDLIKRGVRGDYMNFFGQIDLTVPRLKRSLLLGTRWEDQKAQLVPAPGEPYWQKYTYDPLGLPIAPPPPGGPLGPVPGNPPTPGLNALPPGAVLPISPPPTIAPVEPAQPTSPVFAGPYGPADATPAPGDR
jgi:hypothetical protein